MKLPVQQLAECLNLPPATLIRWIRQGRIPIRKIREDCVFQKAALEKWAMAHNLTFTEDPKTDPPPETPAPESLYSAMARGGVHQNIQGTDFAEVLNNAVARMDFLNAEDQQELYHRLVERETMTSTAIGKGVAIPHPRTPLGHALTHPVIVTCYPEHEVDFSALDDRPVFVLFILISTSVRMHLHLLSRLSFCMRDNSFIRFLHTAPDADALLAKIETFEQQLDQTRP